MKANVYLSAAVIAALAACKPTTVVENNTATGPGTTANVAVNDQANAAVASSGAIDTAFVTDAMKGDNSEVALGELAANKGASQGVKNLGKMLATDHAAHKQEVAALAQQAGVTITGDLKDEAKAEQAKLQGLSGADFDKEFIRATIEDHQKDIAKYEEQAKSDHTLSAAMANKTLPTLRKHLETAQGLAK